jgi:hypothetical protein
LDVSPENLSPNLILLCKPIRKSPVSRRVAENTAIEKLFFYRINTCEMENKPLDARLRIEV